MKKSILIFPLMFLLVSCSEREIDADQLQKRDHVYFAVNEKKPYSGKVTRYYQNGRLMSEGTLKNGKWEDNIMIRNWHENGQLATEVSIVNGEFVTHRWDMNGNPIDE